MNILFFPSWYDSEELPGTGNFFTEQVKALTQAGNKVTVVLVDIVYYPYKCKTKKFRILEQNRDGIEVFRIKVPSYCTGQIPFVFFTYYKFFYDRLMGFLKKRGYEFDVIYAHSFWHAGYIATFYKKKYNIPLIVQEHRSQLVSGDFSQLVNKYLRKTILKSDVFYCVSKNLREVISNRTGLKNKLQVLPNMVSDIFSFKELSNKKEFSFSFVGSLDERKRILFLLKAFEKFCNKYNNVKLSIAGEGPQKTEIVEYISNSAILKNHVNLVGFLNRTQVVDFIADSNAFVLPSTYETFGVVYIESMSVGRPVIATRNGGANDIVNESNGYLIDVDNEEQLITAMEKMVREYDKFNLEQISKDCIEKYSRNTIMGKVLKTMDECIKNYEK